MQANPLLHFRSKSLKSLPRCIIIDPIIIDSFANRTSIAVYGGIGSFHRLENNCVLRQIYNINFHYWAVLGSRGCRENLIRVQVRNVAAES